MPNENFFKVRLKSFNVLYIFKSLSARRLIMIVILVHSPRYCGFTRFALTRSRLNSAPFASLFAQFSLPLNFAQSSQIFCPIIYFISFKHFPKNTFCFLLGGFVYIKNLS